MGAYDELVTECRECGCEARRQVKTLWCDFMEFNLMDGKARKIEGYDLFGKEEKELIDLTFRDRLLIMASIFGGPVERYSARRTIDGITNFKCDRGHVFEIEEDDEEIGELKEKLGIDI